MADIRLTARQGEPNPDDFKMLSKGMLAHHAASGHHRESEKYSVFLKGKDNQVLGGVIVTFLWNGMEINSLWVDESLRNHGWGRKLMETVEEEGRKRGCTLAYTNTFTWQAPEFYKKLGYTLYGKLENFPQGARLSYFCKDLVK